MFLTNTDYRQRPFYLWPSALIFGAVITIAIFYLLSGLLHVPVSMSRDDAPIRFNIVTVKPPAIEQPSKPVPQESTTKKPQPSPTPPKAIKKQPTPKQPRKSVQKTETTKKIEPVFEMRPPTEPTPVTEPEQPQKIVKQSTPSKAVIKNRPQPMPLFKLTSIPRFQKQISPGYPEQMRRLGREGKVELELLIDSDGSIYEVKVVKSAGTLFDKAALDAVKDAKLTPARIGIENVAVKLQIPIVFKLR